MGVCPKLSTNSMCLEDEVVTGVPPPNVILCEIVRQLLEIQRCLRNLELVVIDTVLGILGQTQLFMEKRNAVFKIRHNRACLVYECLRYGNSVISLHLPSKTSRT